MSSTITVSGHAILQGADSRTQNSPSGLVIAGVPCPKSQAGESGLVVEHSIVEQTIAVGFDLVLYDVNASGEQRS